MDIKDPADVVLHIAQVDYENYTIVRQVLRRSDGSKVSPLIFYVDNEWVLKLHDIPNKEAAQSEMDSLILRSILDMTEEVIEALSSLLPQLFDDEYVIMEEDGEESVN